MIQEPVVIEVTLKNESKIYTLALHLQRLNVWHKIMNGIVYGHIHQTSCTQSSGTHSTSMVILMVFFPQALKFSQEQESGVV